MSLTTFDKLHPLYDLGYAESKGATYSGGHSLAEELDDMYAEISAHTSYVDLTEARAIAIEALQPGSETSVQEESRAAYIGAVVAVAGELELFSFIPTSCKAVKNEIAMYGSMIVRRFGAVRTVEEAEIDTVLESVRRAGQYKHDNEIYQATLAEMPAPTPRTQHEKLDSMITGSLERLFPLIVPIILSA